MPHATASRSFETLAEVLAHLGNISADRVRARPAPGEAEETDLVHLLEHSERLYELVDGILVEKPMGIVESTLAMELGWLLRTFLQKHDCGILTGSDGAMRLMPGLVRLPDLAFIAWEQLPRRGEIPDVPVADLAPALAVEVLSESNTPQEMERKLKDYFLAGVRLVWYVDPDTRTVTVYTAPDESHVLKESDTLDGGAVLPGFKASLGELFSRVPRSAASKPKKGRRKS